MESLTFRIKFTGLFKNIDIADGLMSKILSILITEAPNNVVKAKITKNKNQNNPSGIIVKKLK